MALAFHLVQKWKIRVCVKFSAVVHNFIFVCNMLSQIFAAIIGSCIACTICALLNLREWGLTVPPPPIPWLHHILLKYCNNNKKNNISFLSLLVM